MTMEIAPHGLVTRDVALPEVAEAESVPFARDASYETMTYRDTTENIVIYSAH
jgi:hypothetical protein